MATEGATYDVAIVGGGLAGLALSIQLARGGWSVVLCEKETYPLHRVCGEYISMESWDFLCRLGLPLPEWNLPKINTLQLTAPNGKMLQSKLPLGGFGISRYKLDAALAQIAIAAGVTLLQQTKVEAIEMQQHGVLLETKSAGITNHIHAKVGCGAWGKRSNMDVKWKRPFTQDAGTRISNWVGIKYHVYTDWPKHLIALHNFHDGYCGISAIEGGKHCLCYLTRAANLKQYGQSVAAMEGAVLARNPALAGILKRSQKLPHFPLAISQVSFQPKTRVEGGVLLLGDAAGMIAPLCGNGMSMALHASKLAAEAIAPFLQGKISRTEMEQGYTRQWQQHFAARLRLGRGLQGLFGSEWRSNALVGVMRNLPFAARAIIRQTHGQPF